MQLDANGELSVDFLRFEDLEAATLYEILKLRFDIFVLEQESLYPELDGRDQAALHAVARERGGAAVATLRLLGVSGDGPVEIGRVAIAPARRGGGLGRRLMTSALGFLDVHAPSRPVRLGAQRHLLDFYSSLGFARTSDVYDDGGIPHVDMERPGK